MAVLSAGDNLWSVKVMRETTDDWPYLPMAETDDAEFLWYVKPTWAKLVFHRPRGAGGWSPMYLEFHGGKCKQLRMGGWSTRDHGHGVVRLNGSGYYSDSIAVLVDRARDVAERTWRTQTTQLRRSNA